MLEKLRIRTKLILSLALIFSSVANSFAGMHFGLISVIKSKAKQLKEKKDERIRATTPPRPTCGTTVNDADGNTYCIVKIGGQYWMSENMRTTKYPDGSSITKGPSAHGDADWDTDQSYYSCPPNTGRDGEDCAAAETKKLGMLYQWSAAMNGSTIEGAQGICPSGWHIPTHNEFTTLEREVCISGTCTTDFPFDTATLGYRGTDEGTKLKSGGTSGFKALFTGIRRTNGNYFYPYGPYTHIWSSTPSGDRAWERHLSSVETRVERVVYSKAYGFSVRCLKD